MLLSKVKGTYNLRTRRPIRPNPLIPMADMVGQIKIGLRSESCRWSSSLSARIIATRFRAIFCSCQYREGISRKNCPSVRHLVNLVLEVQRESLRLVKYVTWWEITSRKNFESTTLWEKVGSWRSTVCSGPCIEGTSTPDERQESWKEHTGITLEMYFVLMMIF